MAITANPRSVSEATRFTASTPQPSSKAAVSPNSRFASPNTSGSRERGTPLASRNPGPAGETPEQRIKRLRAAHDAAKRAKVSLFDRWVVGSRSFFDQAHRITVFGLFGFTVLVGLVTAYTAVDMYSINRKRKNEFVEKMKQVEADSLEAARLAYMTNTANGEQVALVEEANRRVRAADEGGFKLPSLLGPPTPIRREDGKSASEAAGASVDGIAAAPVLRHTDADAAPTAKSSGWRSWFSSSSRSEEGESVGSSQRRLGYESPSSGDNGVGVRDSDILRAVDEKQAYVKEKARQALALEKQNQRTGGPLDRTGLQATATASSEEGGKKRGWW